MQVENDNNLPFVSILIAARNEESCISSLLISLSKLDYPKNKLQILIGNDDSEDNTQNLIEEFILGQSNIQLINIPKANSDFALKGKARVLSILASYATGDYYLFTDADIVLPKTWAIAMLTGFGSKNIGVVVGLTIVEPKNVFSACQALEWISALRIMKFCSDLKIPTTGMGNNMALSAKAYKEIGGFENIPFSIVEDYAIYKAVIDKGYHFNQLFDKDVLAITQAPKNYFEQRKRWLTGGIESKSNMLIPALLQCFAFPILIGFLFLNPLVSIVIVGISLFLNLVLAFSSLHKLNKSYLLKYVPIYTIYMLIFWFLQFVNYLLPTKIIWKNRSY